MPQFFVQIVSSLEGVKDKNVFAESWFDTIDEAVSLVKEMSTDNFTLVTMRMFTGTKPPEA